MAKHLRPTHACQVHAGEHRPRVADTDVHHVWPKEYGGPDEASNEVEICPSGHRNLHELLREYLHAKGDPGWAVKQRWHPAERELTVRAWTAMVQAGKVDEVIALAKALGHL